MPIFDNGLNPALPGYKGNAAPAPTTPQPNDNPGGLTYNGQVMSGPKLTAAPKPVVPVNVTATPTTTSNTFAQPSKTNFDLQSLITQNQQLQQQFMKSFSTPDPAIQGVQNQLNTLSNRSLNTNLNAQAGIQAEADRVVPMNFITGRQQSIQNQANLQLQSIAAQAQPLTQQLQTLSQNRNQLLKAQEMALSFGKDDIGLAMQIQAATKAEEQSAKQFAMDYGVQQPFYTVDGQTIYRTSDGKAYSTLQEWQADGGTPDKIQTVSGQESGKAATSDIAEYEYAKSQGYTGTFMQYTAKNSGGSRGGSGSGTGSGKIVFTGEDTRRLAGAGFTSAEIVQIQKDINSYGIEAVTEGMSDSQRKAIQNVMSGVTPTQERNDAAKGKTFLSPEWFWQNFTREQLMASAAKAGYTTGGFLGMGKKGDPDKYIQETMRGIETRRSSGQSDEEILKQMQVKK